MNRSFGERKSMMSCEEDLWKCVEAFLKPCVEDEVIRKGMLGIQVCKRAELHRAESMR
jgi:hypothetical protein